MRSVLLDTHILVWWQSDQGGLTKAQTRTLLEVDAGNAAAAISDITLWEAALLVDRGRLQIAGALDVWLDEIQTHPRLSVLPISATVAAESVRLGRDFPKDPADRIIVATARCHGLWLLTADEDIRQWGKVPVI
jgi:PIN domain nuclease of toxin-antitoxin system